MGIGMGLGYGLTVSARWVGKNIGSSVIGRMVSIVDIKPVNLYAMRHGTGIAEVVRSIVTHVNQMGPNRIATGGYPAAIADVQVAFPRAAIVPAKGHERTAVQRGVFYGQMPSANGIESHVAERAAANIVASRYAHVGVHTRQFAVFEQDILTEIGTDNAPASAIR